MRKRLITLAATLMVFAIVPAVSAQQTGSVYVVHGVPDVDVDVYVNGEKALENFKPQDIAGPLNLAAATYQIAITPTGSPIGDAVIRGSATLPAGANVSLVAHLDAAGTPILTAFVNDTYELVDGSARLEVRHTAQAPAVDVLANGDVVFPNLANPKAGGPADVPAGDYAVTVNAAGTTVTAFDAGTLSLEAGNYYMVYAVGAFPTSFSVLPHVIAATSGKAPTLIATGDGGLAGSGGFPMWAAALLALGSLAMLAGAPVLVRSAKHR